MIFNLLLFAVVTLGMVFVILGTVKKNRWGINVAAQTCPRCGTALPRIRKPQSVRQTLWGGSTCHACGAEIDKWGRELVPE